MIRGQKINLRPFTQDDLSVFQDLANDHEYNSQFNDFGLRTNVYYQKSYPVEGFLSSRQGMLVIATPDGEILGDMSYHQMPYGPNEASQVYEIGLTLKPGQRGKGYGVEAQALLAAYLFANYNIVRVQASTDIENLPEQRALEKAGFTREGVIRQAQWRNGAYHDLVLYSKLRGE
ncbi:MAG: acetyltransferase, family [Chloroflexi bacterium]|jgi:RimJ/RimL family protein N-acetyltransferase|nr:acetyltransferase, family [Chloroflexota bacterium]